MNVDDRYTSADQMLQDIENLLPRITAKLSSVKIEKKAHNEDGEKEEKTCLSGKSYDYKIDKSAVSENSFPETFKTDSTQETSDISLLKQNIYSKRKYFTYFSSSYYNLIFINEK